MGTTADKLLYLQGTKSAIKDAIVAKGVTVPIGTTFRDYATKIGEITSGGSSGNYSRPTEWLALPDNDNGVQKISILNAVFDTDSELVALMCQGAYTVDWGDGTSNNYASGVKAEHKYTYSDVDLNSDTIANFTYKQCIITITPQSGQNLTLINLNQYHTSIGSGTSYDLVTGFLDIRINALSCTTLVIGATTASEYVQHRMLEQCVIGQIGNILDSSSMFQNCTSLQSVPLFNLASATTTTSMFPNCYSLQSVSLFNLASATTTTSMFANCSSLQSVPLFNLSSATTTTQMFTNCTSLQSVPLFNLASATTTTSMFQNCYSLKRFLANIKQTQNLSNAKMSEVALSEMYSNLLTSVGQTLTITGNYGIALTPIVSLSGTGTLGSKTITMANTTGLSIGMFVRGTGISTAVNTAVTFTDTGDLVNKTAHGLVNGNIISFNSINTTTGISISTIYYVINATANTFQVSLTQGGTAIALTTNGSGDYNSPVFITAITPNVNITVSLPNVAAVSGTLTFRSDIHKTYLANMKGWTIVE